MKIILLLFATFGSSVCFEKLMEHIKNIHDHKDEELLKFEGEEYMIQSTRKQAKLMFEFMDANGDGLVSKEEMHKFGKSMVSNNTVHLDFWVEGNFKNDENKDAYLNFEEFYTPQDRMGYKPYHEEL